MRLLTALLRTRPGRVAAAGLGAGALALTAGLSAAAPAMATATHPATPAAKTAAASSGYTVQQVNPTTYISPLSKTLTREPLEGNWIIKTRSGSTVREVTSEGNGLDMELHETGFSTFNTSVPTGATGTVYTTPGGYCVHGTDIGLVISSTSCGANNTASQWYGDGNGRLANEAYGSYLGANANAEGETVRLEPSSGAYYLTPFNIG